MYLESLEVVSRLPVPERHRPVVRPTDQDPVTVDRQTVDDGVVAGEVLDELPLGTLPLLDVVRTSTGEHEEPRVSHQASH